MASPSKSAVKIPIPPASSNAETRASAGIAAQDTKLLTWVRTNNKQLLAALLFYASKSGGNEMGEFHTLANQLSNLTETAGLSMAAGAGGSR